MLDGSPVIDVHHHFLPDVLVAELTAMASGKPRLVNDRISLTLNPDLSDVDSQRRAMDHAGVDVAVLTYSGVSVLGPKTCQILNDGLAEVASAHSDCFVPSAHVDLEDDGAVDELRRCVNELGFHVAALPCSSPTRELDDPALEPLWNEIESLRLPVILHPKLLPAGASTDYSLERSCARPFDTTIAAVRLLYGVFPGHRGLRVVLPHCGGTAAILKGRIEMFFDDPSAPTGRQLPRTQTELAACGLNEVFEALFSQFYFDSAGTGGWRPAVEYATSIVGAKRMLFGSDFPLESHSPETLAELVSMIGQLDLDLAIRQAIAGGNALELLDDALAKTGHRAP